MRDLRVSDDVTPAAWIAPRLGGDFGAVTRTVPRGYDAYARICDAVADAGGRAVSWSEVAAAMGAQAHRLMQWHALVGSADPLNRTGSLWHGSDPELGNLEPEALVALCALLGDFRAQHLDAGSQVRRDGQYPGLVDGFFFAVGDLVIAAPLVLTT